MITTPIPADIASEEVRAILKAALDAFDADDSAAQMDDRYSARQVVNIAQNAMKTAQRRIDELRSSVARAERDAITSPTGRTFEEIHGSQLREYPRVA